MARLMKEKPIEVTAKLSKHREKRVAYAKLPNEKEIFVHVAKGLDLDLDEMPLGTPVMLEMTTFDFEKGRIVKVLS